MSDVEAPENEGRPENSELQAILSRLEAIEARLDASLQKPHVVEPGSTRLGEALTLAQSRISAAWSGLKGEATPPQGNLEPEGSATVAANQSGLNPTWILALIAVGVVWLGVEIADDVFKDLRHLWRWMF